MEIRSAAALVRGFCTDQGRPVDNHTQTKAAISDKDSNSSFCAACPVVRLMISSMPNGIVHQ